MKSNSESSKNQIKLLESITGPTTKTKTNSQIMNQIQIDDKNAEAGVYKVFDTNNEDNFSLNSFVSQKTYRPHEKNEINQINIILQNENFNSDEILEEEVEEEDAEEENSLNQNNEIIINNGDIITNNINKNKKNKTKKNQKIRDDNLRKEVLKTPFNILKKYLEKIGDIKLKVNLDNVFGSRFCQNRAALYLQIYTILNFNKANKSILEQAEPEPDKNDIFFYLLTRPYNFIFLKYINNNKQFQIKGEKITIKEFKTLDEVVKEKKADLKNNNKITDEERNDISAKIKKFEEISKGFLKNIENGYFDERNKKKKPKKEKIFFIIRTIDKFENFVQEEEQK